MNTRLPILWLMIVVCFSSAVGQRPAIWPNSAIDRQIRLAGEVEAYIQRDNMNPPEPGSIAFVGSSIFRLWKHLGEQMSPLPVCNRAFGGSRTAEVLFYMDTLVTRLRPSIVVYYCGSNDVNAGLSAEHIADGFIAFSERMYRSDSLAEVCYVSVNKAPQKRNRWDVVDSVNNMVALYCAGHVRRSYIDVNPLLFDSEGKPRLELYVDDLLHFRDEAYVLFASKVKPVLLGLWQKK